LTFYINKGSFKDKYTIATFVVTKLALNSNYFYNIKFSKIISNKTFKKLLLLYKFFNPL